MTGIQNTSFAHVFMCCATKTAKVITVALSSLQRLIILHAVTASLSAIPSTIDHSNNERLHVARCRHTAQDPPDTLLSLVTNFLHHSQRTTRKRTCFVLCSLSSSLTDGLALLPCFRLHESRTVVASSIAAATLHQFPRTSARRAIVPSTCARAEDSGFHPACSGHLSPVSRR
ncbi:hypothetical protein BGY98DRAFT_462744 [Russula aff. rugulosa BPL654]|nr:hypothetical protein BGY98DRAFT_462744 [Russula aff. rugulosa BPL654]